ncbi:hypothetical protein AAKU67_002840 [Oxalobacteraceae bacterium GrIS 2.11]
MQALNSPASRPFGVVNNSLPAATQPGTGPVLPGQETVRVLQVSGKHKRKTTDQNPEPAIPKRLQIQPGQRSASSSSSSSSSSLRTADLTSEVAPIKTSPLERVAAMLRDHAELDGAQMGKVISESARDLGGRFMTATDRDALLTQILGAHASCDAQKIGSMIAALGRALGGPAITAANRDALLGQILGAHASCSGQQMGVMIGWLGDVLGGPVITAENRHAMLAQILGVHATCDAQTMGAMIGAFGRALGRPIMAPANRDALVAQILGAHASCQQLGAIFDGLSHALGGPAMTATNRDALLTQILGAHATCDSQKMGAMIGGLGRALGGRAMTTENRDALLAQILAAQASCSTLQVTWTISALGTALGGVNMTAANRDALLMQILGAHASCSVEKIGAEFDGLVSAIGGRGITATSRDALLTQILGAHTTIDSEKIALMIARLNYWSSTATSAVLPKIARAGATPIKTGMILAALLGKYTAAPHQPELRRILSEVLADIQADPKLRACVDAGCLAASGDILDILTLDELDEGQKLKFFEYSCSKVINMDLPRLRSELGKLMFQPLSATLKTGALSTLLKSGPFDPALFDLVRQTVLGALSQIPDINWKITQDGAELVEVPPEFYAWYAGVKDFYQESKDNMTLDFIRKEKALIGKQPLLPAAVKESILDLLRIREEELTKAGLG